MSYVLKTKKGGEIVIKPMPSGKGVWINDDEVEMDDFLTAVAYILTNFNFMKLSDDDLRLAFVRSVKKAKVVPGWDRIKNPKSKRLKIPGFAN